MDENYNATRLLTKEVPTVEDKPEYKLKPILSLPHNLERKGVGGLRTKGYFKKSYENKPLISIVTVVYNGEKYLEQTIKSVIEQTYNNVEYIIIDGSSTDNTLDIIKQYDEYIDYWVSEFDSGIYDAMNKGISLCTGDYIAFLNADDWYNGDAIESIVFSITQNDIAFIFANVDIFNTNDEFRLTYREKFSRYQLVMPFGHPTLFVQRDILLSLPFDQKYPTAADYDFICKIIKQKLPFFYLDKSIVNFREGGISTSSNTEKELVLLRYHHFGILTAIHFYLITTKQPVISKLVKMLIKIKKQLRAGVK